MNIQNRRNIMKDCIFCKIIKGDIPASKIYEDEKIFVFLDVNPSTNGHMLVIPKEHYQDLFSLDEEIIVHSVKVIKEKLYPLMKDRLHCDGLTISQNNGFGQEVKHYHIHLVPRYKKDQSTITYNQDLLLPIDQVYSILKEK